MAITVCTENPIENVKSYGLNSYIISLRYCIQKHCPTSSGREPRIEIELVRKCAPYMSAINHYILIARETTSESKKVLTSFSLKLSLKFDHVQSVSDWL